MTDTAIDGTKESVHFATVNEGPLYQALSLVMALQKLQGRTATPFYKQAKLTTLGEILIVRATDLELSLVCDVPMASQSSSGLEICVSTDGLFSLLTSKGLRTFTLALKGEGLLEVTASNGNTATVPTFPVGDFPLIPELESNPENTHLTRPYSAWRRPLELLRHCMSKDETRLNLNGLWFGTQTEVAGTKRKKRPLPEEVEWCATDGHRMVVTKDDPEWGGGFPKGVIIPRTGVELFLKLVAQPKRGSATMDPMATLSQNPKQPNFVFLNTGDGSRLAIRTIDSDFPNYTQIVPTQPPNYVLTVQRQQLLEAVASFKGFAKTTKGLTLQWEGSMLTLTVTDGDASRKVSVRTAEPFTRKPRPLKKTEKEEGLTQEDINVLAAASTSFIIGINRHYLTDLCTALPGDDLIIRFTDEVSPMVFADPKDSRTVALIMPLRI